MSTNTATAPTAPRLFIDGIPVNTTQWDEFFYPLTPCCKATATGTEDGTACRGCYELISPEFGGEYTADDLI